MSTKVVPHGGLARPSISTPPTTFVPKVELVRLETNLRFSMLCVNLTFCKLGVNLRFRSGSTCS